MLLKRGIVVSCQATKEEPLHGSKIMARMAKAAEEGGAVGIRANTPEDIKEIKATVKLPVIGIFKDKVRGFNVYITPTMKHVARVVKAGADLIAIDCTRRVHPQSVEKIFSYIRKNYTIPIIADVADFEDALLVSKLKPDFIATTLSGYTDYSKNRPTPDIELVREISENIQVPVIAEGNYTQPEQAFEAFVAGAFAVVIGGAITRPQQTTKRFVSVTKGLLSSEKEAIGIDVGGTHTRGGLIRSNGSVIRTMEGITTEDSPLEGVENIIDKLALNENVSVIGVGTAGRVDFEKGEVVYSTGNLRNWSKIKLKSILETKYSIPVIVDNDVNAATYAHWFLMKGKPRNMSYIAVGTGLGGGLILDGELYRGKHGNAGEIGHIVIPGNERKCTCGKTGCVETLLSGRFIREEYEKAFGDFAWDDFLKRLNSEDAWSKSLINEISSKAAWLVDLLVNTLDIEKIYFGGIVEDFGNLFIGKIREKLSDYILNGQIYEKNIVELSPLKKMGAIIGAGLEAIHFVGGV